MDHIIRLDSLVEILLAISLSAAVGFRVFVPFLVVSIAAVLGHLDLPSNFDWAETPQAVIVLAIACALEIGGYYIPWFDHILDIVATPAAMIAGTLVAFSLAPEMNPVLQWTLAIIAGGGTAGLIKTLMNILRGTSTAASGGLTNPILATVELVMAIAITILAITVPLVAGIAVIWILGYGIYRLTKFLAKTRSPQPPAPAP